MKKEQSLERFEKLIEKRCARLEALIDRGAPQIMIDLELRGIEEACEDMRKAAEKLAE